MNPIISLMAQFSPLGQAIRQAQSAVQSGNPLQMLGQNSPQMQQVMDFISQNGGDPEQAFYQLAKERGVDPGQILNQVRGMMK